MLRATRRYLKSPAWLAIGLVVLLPALAEAQLFPNRSLNRQRTPCAAESPFNAQVRRDYFGYYPTCWTRFPDGWGCPGYNPEAPNIEASLRRIPLTQNRITDEFGPDPENPDMPNEGAPNNPPGEGPNIPAIPNPGRSPFELDPSPRPVNPKPAEPDPFDTPVPTNPKPGNPAAPPANRPVPPTGLMEMPSLPATTPTARVESILEPGSMMMVPEPEATLTSNSTSSRPDLGPLPSVPVPSATYPGNVVAEPETITGTPVPAQAPKRRSILGSLFGSRNSQKR